MSEVASILDTMLEGNFQTAVPRARKLSINSFREIRTLLEGSRDKHQRKLCYWILTHLAVSTRSAEIGRYAAERVGKEQTVSLKLEALKTAMFTDGIQDSAVLESMLDHKNREIRRAAVDALGACVGHSAENALVKVMSDAQNPTNMFEAARSLARMCSPAVIPHLQAQFENLPRRKPNEPTLSALVIAMARHPVESSSTIVRNELKSISLWQLGWACLNYISTVATVADEEFVVGYIDRVLSRMKRGSQIYVYAITFLRDLHPTEICAGLAALRKIGDSPTSALIDRLIPHWSDLTYHDHVWLAQHYASKVDGLEPYPPP